MRKIIIGNWKMHGDAATAHTLVERVAAAAAQHPDREIIVCPPATLMQQVVCWLIGSSVKTGGQDCHSRAEGAFTGDISAAMLKEAGCAYVLTGHSERRRYHFETSEEVSKKAGMAIASGLIPVVCLGETGDERDSGLAEQVVAQQITESLPQGIALNSAGYANFLLAYEPVWAIGSGKIPTGEEIAHMHGVILAQAAKRAGFPLKSLCVLYGGSVTAANSAGILALPGVSGLLVGGASLKADEFCNIIAS